MNKLGTTLFRNAAPGRVTAPQRPASAQPVAPRQVVRVLQSGRAPAQLSLFLRPANAR